jgi:hypothetical protein
VKQFSDLNLTAFIGVSGAIIGGIGTFIAALGQVAGGLLQMGLSGIAGGVAVFGEAIELVTSVLATSMGPAIDLIIAALLTLAEDLAGPMQDAMQSFFKDNFDAVASTLGGWIDTVEDWISQLPDMSTLFFDTIQTIITALKLFTAAVIGATVGLIVMMAMTNPLAAAIAGLTAGIALIVMGIVGLFTGGKKEAESKSSEQREQERKQKQRDTLIRNMERSINARQVEIGKKGNIGFSSIADVAKQVQMNAMRNDIEAQTLQVQIQQLETERMMLQEIKNRPITGPTTK